MRCVWVMVFAAMILAGNAQQESCLTQGGQRGNCVAIQLCPQLHDLLRRIQSGTADISAFSVLRRSICRFQNGTPLVCCANRPTQPVIRPTQPSISFPRPNPKPINPTPTPGNRGASLLPESCGEPFHRDFIINGDDAPLGAWPWIAILRLKSGPNAPGVFACGGTLISERYVLTAAHCIRFIDLENIVEYVRVGEHTLTRTPDCFLGDCAPSPQDIPVEEVILHESFNPNSKTCIYCHDIALLRLAVPATLHTRFVSPLCIPMDLANDADIRNGNFTNIHGWVAGWGATEHGTSSDILQEAILPINYNFCQIDSYPDRNMVLCAGGASNQQDACRGDSGGPLVVFKNGGSRQYLLGIVSKGPLICGAARSQGIYTSVHYYRDWIISKLRA